MKNIIVTGSNRGIGFGIVQSLAAKKGWNIIMACRNMEKTKKAMDSILHQNPEASIQNFELDISNQNSIRNFSNKIKENYKNIDVLLNNAGVMQKNNAFNLETLKWVFQTNVYGTINLTEAILPHMAEKSKILVHSGFGGFFTKVKNQKIKSQLLSNEMTKEKLLEIMKQYEESVENNSTQELGLPKNIYAVSKIAMMVYPRILARNQEVITKKIQCFSVYPGYVATDLTDNKGPMTIQQGAKASLNLIQNEIQDKFQGQFFSQTSAKQLK